MTAEEIASLMGLGRGRALVLPLPGASFDEDDLIHLAGLYRGLADPQEGPFVRTSGRRELP